MVTGDEIVKLNLALCVKPKMNVLVLTLKSCLVERHSSASTLIYIAGSVAHANTTPVMETMRLAFHKYGT